MERGRVKQQNKPPVKIFNLNISYMLGYHDFSEVMNISELLYIMWAHLLIPGCHKLINWYFSACTSPNTFRVVLFIHLQENLVFLLPGISIPGKVSLRHFETRKNAKFLVTSSSGNSNQVDGSGEPAPENQLISDSTRCGTGSSWFCSTSFQLFQGQEGINIPDKVLNQNVT